MGSRVIALTNKYRDTQKHTDTTENTPPSLCFFAAWLTINQQKVKPAKSIGTDHRCAVMQQILKKTKDLGCDVM